MQPSFGALYTNGEQYNLLMCGLIGKVKKQEGQVSGGEPLEAALKFLARRGPDASRVWCSDDGRVELLHARLAIVDSDRRADQPLADENSGVCVAFVGEIYNYQELQFELGAYPFKTSSDTEVLLALYQKWGLEGFKRLRGMFSLVIVDCRKKRLYLVRDPIGKKPLFCADWPNGVYFGSSALALVSASGHRPSIQHELLEEYWNDGYIPSDKSIFENCSPVLPGEIIEINWNGEICGRSSCAPKTLQENSSEDLTEINERISDLLRQSVHRRLTNNPNPVSLLSGGIDSTVVTQEAGKQGNISALTIGSFIPLDLDEKYACYAARKMNLPLQVVRSQSHKIIEDVAWALDLQDEPLGMISFFPLALLIRSAKQYGRVLLTGDGGDEVFLGYGKPRDWIDGSQKEQKGQRDQHHGRILSVGCSPPEWMSVWGRTTVTRSLLGHMFTKLDRASAEQGVEVRCPLLDWDLLSYVRGLPPDTLFFNGRTKALLKNQLQSWPKWFVERPKMGFPYRLRWRWGLVGFSGLRELVRGEVVDRFRHFLPAELGKTPDYWGRLSIFHHFNSAWKLLTWSRFQERLRTVSA